MSHEPGCLCDFGLDHEAIDTALENLSEQVATLTAERDKLYQELHRFDPDREQAGDWLPLSLREAVASLSPEQRVVVCDWYWRTSLIFKTHQTQISALEAERDAKDLEIARLVVLPDELDRTIRELRAERDALRTALEDVQAIQTEYDRKPYMIPVAGWMAVRERLQHADVA